MDHNEYEGPGCGQLAEDHIVRDVYGCDAGRNCAEATLEQRIGFEKQIAERLAGLPQTPEET
jgi:hypothetical protein